MSRGWIRNLGHVERSALETEFARSDVLIFPSHHDTYGWVIVEAKRYGVPTIATDFYSRSEIISHEIDGLLVPEPFENPFFPISNIMYGEAFIDISGRGELVVGDAIADYVRQLTGAIRRLAEDRALLATLGETRAHRRSVPGQFSVASRLARLTGSLVLTRDSAYTFGYSGRFRAGRTDHRHRVPAVRRPDAGVDRGRNAGDGMGQQRGRLAGAKVVVRHLECAGQSHAVAGFALRDIRCRHPGRRIGGAGIL